MKRLGQQGVTVIELLVVIIVSGIVMGVISSFTLSYWTNSSTLDSSQQLLVTRLNSGDYLRESLNAASGLITQNDLPDSNTGNPDPADSTQTYWLPIHAVPGTISMGAPGVITPVVYYNRPSIDTSKNIVLNGTIPYGDDIILYLNGTTKQLLARTIANSSAANNRAKTSCPAALATTNCPADSVVAENVSSVVMRYFSRSGNPIDYTSSTDPITGDYTGPDFPSVEVIEFTINFYRKGRLYNAKDSTNQTVIRVALRNY